VRQLQRRWVVLPVCLSLEILVQSYTTQMFKLAKDFKLNKYAFEVSESKVAFWCICVVPVAPGSSCCLSKLEKQEYSNTTWSALKSALWVLIAQSNFLSSEKWKERGATCATDVLAQ